MAAFETRFGEPGRKDGGAANSLRFRPASLGLSHRRHAGRRRASPGADRAQFHWAAHGISDHQDAARPIWHSPQAALEVEGSVAVNPVKLAAGYLLAAIKRGVKIYAPVAIAAIEPRAQRRRCACRAWPVHQGEACDLRHGIRTPEVGELEGASGQLDLGDRHSPAAGRPCGQGRRSYGKLPSPIFISARRRTAG